MSEYCIHEKIWDGSRSIPAEVWCEIDADHNCDNCPYRCSNDSFFGEDSDYQYELRRDSLDF